MSELVAGIVRAGGKGPGYIALAFFCTGALFFLAAKGVDVASLTAPLGVVLGAVYGGGAAKVITEAIQNGKGS